ncbi:MAG: hypothetical protein AAF585_28400 [Verrucomicrobiota bacterium]
MKLAWSAVLIGWCAIASAVELDQEPINYWTRESHDPVALLERKIVAGEASLRGDSQKEVLRQLLDYLEVPIESQVLVYSQTSAQNSRIRPHRPRAIYFSDNCYVGWVQGGGIEVIAFDEHLGAVCYFIDVVKFHGEREPPFTRPRSCLNCHERSTTGNVPGVLVRSVFPARDGMPMFSAGTFYVDDSTPIENRWGGWYVTGNSGNQPHMGNAIAREEDSRFHLDPVVSDGIQLENLDGVIDSDPYLGGGHSDIVALMVFEHQVRMHNTLVAANLSIRQLRHRTEQMHKSFGEPMPEKPEGIYKRVIENQAKKIVERLLFRDEHILDDDGVEGGAAFQDAFLANRKPGADGRALKDLRLYERIFKYRCSYVIYSDVFDHLPQVLKDEVYRQLKDALSGAAGNESSNHLSWTERDRILEILLATKTDFPKE